MVLLIQVQIKQLQIQIEDRPHNYLKEILNNLKKRKTIINNNYNNLLNISSINKFLEMLLTNRVEGMQKSMKTLCIIVMMKQNANKSIKDQSKIIIKLINNQTVQITITKMSY